MKRKDLTGRLFGRLTVIKYSRTNKGQAIWLCRCSCGAEKEVTATHLLSGRVVSCGCFRNEMNSKRMKWQSKKHGMSRSLIYKKYRGMLDRCYNRKNAFYERYGGRGITVCQEWKNDFMKFYEWSMDNGYVDGLSIDRIDNNKGYSPDNCRFVPLRNQQNNKCSNRMICHNGESMCVADWSRRIGISAGTIFARLNKGWDIERTLKQPVEVHSRSRFHNITYNGETMNVAQWARKIGIKVGTLRARLRKGWDIEKALTTPLLA